MVGCECLLGAHTVGHDDARRRQQRAELLRRLDVDDLGRHCWLRSLMLLSNAGSALLLALAQTVSDGWRGKRIQARHRSSPKQRDVRGQQRPSKHSKHATCHADRPISTSVRSRSFPQRAHSSRRSFLHLVPAFVRVLWPALLELGPPFSPKHST